MTYAASPSDVQFEQHPADAWHGHPRDMSTARARALVGAVDALWRAQATAVVARNDQECVDRWFDPVARGGRLRAALDVLPEAADLVDEPPALTRPFATDAGMGRLLITPEGRELQNAVATALREATRDAESIRLSWAQTDDADRRLFELYRRFAMGRLESVVGLRGGSAPPLLAQGVGLVLLLLLNGNVGPARALPRPESSEDLRAVDDAVAAVTGAFADALSPSKPGRRRSAAAYSLYGGYAMSEARRRLGSDLTTDPVYLAASSEDRVLDRLADEIRRRPEVDENRLAAAMRAFVGAYERWRPVLAAHALAQGRTSAADALTRGLVHAYGKAR
jgi:hypothetical protein